MRMLGVLILCGSLWPLAVQSQPQLSAGRVRSVTSPEMAHVRRIDVSKHEVFQIRWQRSVVQSGLFRTVIASFGAPAIAAASRVVVVGTGEGDIWGLHLDDGRVLWRHTIGTAFEATATIMASPPLVPEFGEWALLSARDGTLYAVDVLTGAVLWSTALGAESRAPVIQSADLQRLWVTTVDNRLMALDARSGVVVWSQGRAAPVGLTIDGHAAAAEHNGMVLTGFSDGSVAAYRSGEGQPLWVRPLSLHGSQFGDADATPVFGAGDRIFAASYAEGVYALSPQEGDIVWHRPMVGVTAMATTSDLVIAASSVTGTMWGLEQSTGDVRFRTQLAPGPMPRVIALRGVIILTAGDMGLVVLDEADGQPLQVRSLASRLEGPAAWQGADLAVLAGSGVVYLLRPVSE